MEVDLDHYLELQPRHRHLGYQLAGLIRVPVLAAVSVDHHQE